MYMDFQRFSTTAIFDLDSVAMLLFLFGLELWLNSLYKVRMLQQPQSQRQRQQLPFIYLFMYPFLSHELVFIIGRIYVVKLCGKLAKSLILLVLCGRSVSSFALLSRSFSIHPV